MVKNKLLPISSKSILGISAGFLICSLFFVFFYLPLGRLFEYAFSNVSDINFSTFFEILFKTINLKALWFSITQGWWSAFFCIVFGIPMSYFLARYHFQGRKLLISLLTVSFILPSMVVLLGFLSTFGPGGWVVQVWTKIFPQSLLKIDVYGNYAGILIAHIFYNVSIVIRMGIPTWRAVDYEQVWIAKSLGASRIRIFFKIILPQIKHTIYTAGLLIFLYCFNSFAIVLTLGEARFQTLEVRIYKEIQVNLDFQEASLLAILQIVLNLIIIGFYTKYDSQIKQRIQENHHSFPEELLFSSQIRLKNWIIRMIFLILMIFVCVFLLFPLFNVIALSFIPDLEGNTWFSGYAFLFNNNHISLLGTTPFTLVKNTLLFACLNAFISLFVASLIVLILRQRFERIQRYHVSLSDRFINILILLPMATSSISLAVGLFLQFKQTWLYHNLGWILIVLAHTLISVPFATRALLDSYQSINIELLNVAATLGANRYQIFRRIEFPLIFRGFIIAATFAFAISIGEFGATLFLAHNHHKTLAIGISSLISTRSYQYPASMASLLIYLTFLAFFIIENSSYLSSSGANNHGLVND